MIKTFEEFNVDNENDWNYSLNNDNEYSFGEKIQKEKDHLDIDPYGEDDWGEDVVVENAGIEMLVGKTLTYITINSKRDEIRFFTDKNRQYLMYHEQNCCESVGIEDVVGDLNDLIGTPILRATEDTNRNENPPTINGYHYLESYTWTFYNISTIKGNVTIRWFGESNGYYSERVDFLEINEN